MCISWSHLWKSVCTYVCMHDHRHNLEGHSWKVYLLLGVHVYPQFLSSVRLFVTPWTVACQAPLSMGFSRQEYWSELPCPSPRDLPDPGIEPKSPALTDGFFTTEPPGKSIWWNTAMKKKMDVYHAIVILNERSQKTRTRVHTVYIGLLVWVPQAALLKR